MHSFSTQCVSYHKILFDPAASFIYIANSESFESIKAFCFLFPALFSASYFLLPASCFLPPASCFLAPHRIWKEPIMILACSFCRSLWIPERQNSVHCPHDQLYFSISLNANLLALRQKGSALCERELPGTATVTDVPLQTSDNEPHVCENGTSCPEVRAFLSQAKRSYAEWENIGKTVAGSWGGVGAPTSDRVWMWLSFVNEHSHCYLSPNDTLGQQALVGITFQSCRGKSLLTFSDLYLAILDIRALHWFSWQLSVPSFSFPVTSILPMDYLPLSKK